ncbi:hypothetical protein [Phormidium sp. CCY1219]|nr:hypothetical protein [Phormidium sp. CCY1219]MEB3828295.1 hypothetical protein [Phormidium sp. CCY1219]
MRDQGIQELENSLPDNINPDRIRVSNSCDRRMPADIPGSRTATILEPL